LVKTLVFDGRNLTVRSFFAYPEALGVGGQGTNLIHGALLEIFKFVAMFQPEKTVIAWDSREKSRWRRAIYSEYKAAKRTSLSTDQLKNLDRQQKIVREAINNLSIQQLEVDGVEGDDLVAYAVIIPENRPAVIISTDRDFWQLVRGDLVKVYDPRKKFLLAGSSFSQHTGFDSPEHHLAYKVLKGDPGDGVPPAVIRMGEKKAKELARKFKMPPLNKIPDAFDNWGLPYDEKKYDVEFSKRCARNFKLVSLHCAVVGQMKEIGHFREVQSPKRDWDRFIKFCGKYELRNVAKAYTEVDKFV